jgi:hypothetical protein
MRIRMLCEMTGSRDGEPWPKKGEEADLPTAAAAHLIAAGVAEQVEDDDPPGKGEDKPRKARTGGRRAAVSDS